MGNQRRSIPCPSPKEQKPIYYVKGIGRRRNQNIHEDPTNTTNQVNKNGGLCELTEPHAHQAWSWAPLQSPTGEHLEQAIRLGFSASTMKQNMRPILSGLDLALALSVSKSGSTATHNSVRHVQKEYEVKDARMARYLAKVRNTLQQFTEWTIEKIKRADNGRADALAGIAASLPIKEAILLPIHVQVDPSVADISTYNAIEANQADSQEWTYVTSQHISGQALYPEIPNRHTKSGCKLPVSP
ncbi:hypothetical protein CK203_061556 [Vitis vinifera]|uniref:RNase H type-1 domain-containing protein n=1 Tax=Vitis vinifera TaxID=29760 RepID=A0A438FQR3_VITVI|nr:hypothetical protein CK203_061556 [Vitis vinifera]